MKLCECGCGQPLPTLKRRTTKQRLNSRRLIRGHGHKGRLHPLWNGGRFQNKQGYWLVWIPGHHLAEKSGYVREHRLNWETANARRLKPGEVVHHINGDRGDNRPENLIAMTQREHMSKHQMEPAMQALQRDMKAHLNSDQAFTKKKSDSIKKSWTPQKHQQHSERMRQQWADPERRKRHSDALKRNHAARKASRLK